MRKVVSHTFVTLDGVGAPDAVIDTIVELRDSKEILRELESGCSTMGRTRSGSISRTRRSRATGSRS
jgi:hypothetical protein